MIEHKLCSKGCILQNLPDQETGAVFLCQKIVRRVVLLPSDSEPRRNLVQESEDKMKNKDTYENKIQNMFTAYVVSA